MKKKSWLAVLLLGMALWIPEHVKAQSVAQDLETLALDYQKLAGLKKILQQMYQGYKIVSTGYNSVKGIAQGNFNLHQVFLDGLYVVSPAVRKYPRVAAIINDQEEIVSEYKSAFGSFRQGGQFSASEISYMADVYNHLISASLQNLDELTLVITDNKLRMSDDERLRAIDRIYTTGHDQLTFLRQFNVEAQSVARQRAAQASQLRYVKKISGIQ